MRGPWGRIIGGGERTIRGLAGPKTGDMELGYGAGQVLGRAGSPSSTPFPCRAGGGGSLPRIPPGRRGPHWNGWRPNDHEVNEKAEITQASVGGGLRDVYLASWGLLGGPWVPFWTLSGSLGAHFRSICEPLGTFLFSWGRRGWPLKRLGRPLGCLGWPLGLQGGFWSVLGAIFGAQNRPKQVSKSM